MSRQSKIRNTMINTIFIECNVGNRKRAEIIVDKILKDEAKQGVVIQREVEEHEDNYGSYPFEYEPLIEVKK